MPLTAARDPFHFRYACAADITDHNILWDAYSLPSCSHPPIALTLSSAVPKLTGFALMALEDARLSNCARLRVQSRKPPKQ